MTGIMQMFVGRSPSGPVTGQQLYDSPGGTFTWVCPAGVTSVSVVCIGTGVYAGGGLGYKNNISVTPGASYTVYVANNAYNSESYFISPTTVAGKTPPNTTPVPRPGGGYVGDGGGNGGGWYNSYGSGGGGAGGYSGNGGDGTAGGTATAGSGGGGGGGYGNGTNVGGGGGGVGVLGAGSNGAAGTSGSRGGGGGSGGNSGTAGDTTTGGNGGTYGAGTGLAGTNFGSYAVGAVRIIWPGDTRSFPSTNTGNL